MKKMFGIQAAVCAVVTVAATTPALAGGQSVARQWNEVMLEAIRHDFARPTVHARNLFHVSVAMWDAWAVYDDVADTYLNDESQTSMDVEADRAEAISFAAYQILKLRFQNSPGAATSLPAFDALMDSLGYDKSFSSTVGNSPAAVGNRCAAAVLAFGAVDNSNESNGYVNQFYAPVNDPLLPDFPGNPDISDPNRWQPLALDFFIDQSGNVIVGGFPEALSPEWGIVTPFALSSEDLTIYHRDGFDYWVYHDPGDPPYHGTATDQAYKDGFVQVVEYSSTLDPSDGVMIDISPASRGNSTPGTNDGTGYKLNPITGMPYTPEVVPAGDYYRVLAEFWADGPDSETPPGHWFTLANYVSDHPMTVKQLNGQGPVLNDLEWDVKIYLALGGAMHDAAVASWGVKGWYDYVRPVSAIRYMADQGQSSDPMGPSYDPNGIPLVPDLIEVVTSDTTQVGERHEHLAGEEGKIAIKAWKGPDFILDPMVDTAGVDWILAENWWPYQRPSFVSPPFPGYVSGHSTYSRTAAELLTRFTGSEFWPGGMGVFDAPQNDFLVFEEGPSVDIELQWARYADAADECSLSRIYGGIHPPQDDIPGRLMGLQIGPDAWDHALTYFLGTAVCPGDLDGDGMVNGADLATLLANWNASLSIADLNGDGIVDGADLASMLALWNTTCP
jgi:hypothetical protein